MINNQDLLADVEMYFKQIRELTALILHAESTEMTNILTINELAENGHNKLSEYKEYKKFS